MNALNLDNWICDLTLQGIGTGIVPAACPL